MQHSSAGSPRGHVCTPLWWIFACRRDAVLAEEKRFDDEARTLTSKAVEVEGLLYSGSVASPRELQSLQADLEQIKRHRASLEDRELEIMEQRESLDAEVAAGEEAVTAAADDVERLQAEIAAAEAVVDAEIEVETEARQRAGGDARWPLDRRLRGEARAESRCRSGTPAG